MSRPIDTSPLPGGAAELVITRPRVCTFGALRRFRLELDGDRVDVLRYGATVRIPVEQGVHLLRVCCPPLWPVSLPIELAPGQTIRLQTCVDPYQDLHITRDDRRDDRWTDTRRPANPESGR